MRIICHAITSDPELYAAWSSIDGMSIELLLLERVGELQGFQGKFISTIMSERSLRGALCNESNENLG
ncbi:hypothetical protein BKA82DRAFT_1004739 [Pisolithus tinctorius]|uniref:Uncharacterized protein n=1 Tax=Pisolithus tinctorius Marx 270 TaxID=870435 RepID=A0A0C3IRC1_PISTI|nr:hypothetical protein BKA82DRAFT_1004739 [Pisolithus tinctorius]KIN99477.1 hypothetical protein M404DRAFT_1004739 [Pisolithus tinctorius Marx 270]